MCKAWRSSASCRPSTSRSSAFALTWDEFFLGYTLAAQNAQTMPMAVQGLNTKDGIMLEYTGSHVLLAVLPPVLLLFGVQGVLARALSFGSVSRRGAS